MSFGVGNLVVCVDGRARDSNWLGKYRPTKGCIYTVRGVSDIPDEGVGVYLEEIVNPINPWSGLEFCFRPSRFRPVRKTDIFIFTSMLAPTPKEKVNENA